jgi:hypothetical protein
VIRKSSPTQFNKQTYHTINISKQTLISGLFVSSQQPFNGSHVAHMVPSRSSTAVNMSTLTLTTIPPELLLQIISHLPSSASFYALSRTSRQLQAFLHTHAATICNTHITTHHALVASILLSLYDPSGWLIPTHPCVSTEEQRITRDKILFARCDCRTCRRFLLSSRTMTGSGSSLTLSEMSLPLSLAGGWLNCIPCTPGILPSKTGTTQCKAAASLAKITKLTTPGPQYLVFLEKYGRDIEIRNSLRFHHRRSRSDSVESEADGRKPEGENITQEEKERARFDFLVGNYSVRRFLEDVEREMLLFSSHCEQNPKDGAGRMGGSAGMGKWRRIKENLSERWRCLRGTQRYRERLVDVEVDVKILNTTTTKRALMFGEIEKAPVDLNILPHGESWVKGLLWFPCSKEASPLSSPRRDSCSQTQPHHELHEIALPSTLSPSSSMQTQSLPTEQHQNKLSPNNLTGENPRGRARERTQHAIAKMRSAATRETTRLRQAMRKMRCGEGFQSLDD